MAIDFDFSEFASLTESLGRVADGAGPRIRQAVERTARNVKDSWNGKLYREGHAKLTGRSVTYDLRTFSGLLASDIEAEIGPETGSGKQAGLVRLLENGSVHNAPHGYGAAALQENEADLEHGLSEALRLAEEEAGL